MNLTDLASAAVWGATSRPTRTTSVLLSLASGVAAVVFVSAVVAGFGKEIERLSFGAYARALVVRENVLVQDRHGPPSLADQQALAGGIEGVESTAIWRMGRATTRVGNEMLSLAVFGVDGDYRIELDTPLAEGRWLTNEETAGYARVCLLGLEAAEKLRGGAQIGKRIRINGMDCEIVGILGEPRSRPANRFLESAVAPFRAAERYLLDDVRTYPGDADWLTVIMTPGSDLRETEMAADRLLRKRRGSPLSDPSPFTFGDSSAASRDMDEQRGLIARLLTAVAALTLAASLTAFGGISAAAMATRRREIALRMAMGASESDVAKQVLLEYAGLGLAGGAVGLLVGLGLGWAAAEIWAWPFAPDLRIGGVAIMFGLLVGLTVGGFLARRATKLPPSLAARS